MGGERQGAEDQRQQCPCLPKVPQSTRTHAAASSPALLITALVKPLWSLHVLPHTIMVERMARSLGWVCMVTVDREPCRESLSFKHNNGCCLLCLIVQGRCCARRQKGRCHLKSCDSPSEGMTKSSAWDLWLGAIGPCHNQVEVTLKSIL